MSSYAQGFDAFNSHDFPKHQNLDFLSFTSPSEIITPSPDHFETELDSSLAGFDFDDSQIHYFLDPAEPFTIVRSEPSACGPPSTITASSESAYDSQTTYSSENYYNNYASSVYTPTTYSSSLSEMDIQRLDLNSFGLTAIDPSSFGTLPLTPPPNPSEAPQIVSKSYEKYVPRSYSDYAPGSRTSDFFTGPYRQQPTVSPNHISTPNVTSLPTPPADDAAQTDPRRKFKCDVCSRAFARAFNLKTHMATHDPNRQKPFVCRHRSCGRSFSRKHDLGRHLISIHRDDSVLPSHPSAKKVGVERSSRTWCEQCGKSYFGKELTCNCHNVK